MSMTPSKNKQLALNIISTVIVYAVSLAISFLLTPYIVNKLGVAAYGFVGLSNNIIGYTSLVTIALNSMAGRFITIEYHKGNFDKANQYFSSVFFCNLFLGAIMLLATVGMVFFLELIIKIPEELVADVKILFATLAVNSVIGLILGGFGISTFVKNRLELSSIRSIISSIIRLTVLSIAFGLFAPHVWYIGFTALICSIYIVFTNIHFLRTLTPELKIKRVYFEWGSVKELTLSGLWNVVSKLSDILSRGLDLLLADLFISATAMGMLSVSLVIPMLLLQLCATIASCFAPQLTEMYSKGDIHAMQGELIKSIRLVGFFASIPIGVFFVFADRFYGLWVPTQNQELLYKLTMCACIAMPFAMPQEGLWNIFTITNTVKKSSINLLMNSIVSISIVMLSMIFIKDDIIRLFVLASTRAIVALFRILTFLPMQGAKCLGLKRTLFYPYIFRSVFNFVVICVIGFIIKYYITGTDWFTFILTCSITAIFGIAVNYFVSLSASDRAYVKHIVLHKLHI